MVFYLASEKAALDNGCDLSDRRRSRPDLCAIMSERGLAVARVGLSFFAGRWAGEKSAAVRVRYSSLLRLSLLSGKGVLLTPSRHATTLAAFSKCGYTARESKSLDVGQTKMNNAFTPNAGFPREASGYQIFRPSKRLQNNPGRIRDYGGSSAGTDRAAADRG